MGFYFHLCLGWSRRDGKYINITLNETVEQVLEYFAFIMSFPTKQITTVICQNTQNNLYLVFHLNKILKDLDFV